MVKGVSLRFFLFASTCPCLPHVDERWQGEKHTFLHAFENVFIGSKVCHQIPSKKWYLIPETSTILYTHVIAIS